MDFGRNSTWLGAAFALLVSLEAAMAAADGATRQVGAAGDRAGVVALQWWYHPLVMATAATLAFLALLLCRYRRRNFHYALGLASYAIFVPGFFLGLVTWGEYLTTFHGQLGLNIIVVFGAGNTLGMLMVLEKRAQRKWRERVAELKRSDPQGQPPPKPRRRFKPLRTGHRYVQWLGGVLLVMALVSGTIFAAPFFEHFSDQEPTETNMVTIRDFKYLPAVVVVEVNTTVTWTNEDDVVHDVWGSGIASPALAKGDSFSFTFNRTGTYEYICTYHPFMQAKVIVR